MNIIYFVAKISRPVGGVKVIHRHSELININFTKSQVYYHLGDTNPDLQWFSSEVSIKRDNNFDPANDFVILPESQILGFWKELRAIGVRYGIFVQNGYFTNQNLDLSEEYSIYENAEVILCISQDAIKCISTYFPFFIHKILRVTYSIDEHLFSSALQKEKKITYMPRKMKNHSDIVIPYLSRLIPNDWRIVPIDNMDEKGVAYELSTSSIFLAFSDLEGLPVPPVEAAFCGNIVIGYTGQGGKEYWNSPQFFEIDSGNISTFISTTQEVINRLSKYPTSIDTSYIRSIFSKETELAYLSKFVNKLIPNR